MQAHLEDRLGLRFREPVAALAHPGLGAQALGPRRDVPGARQHFRHRARAPGARQQRDLGFGGRRRALDGRDHLVDVRQRDGEALEDVGSLARLAQVVHRAPRDHFAPVPQERFEHFLERQELRLAVLQGDHVDAEHRLHRRLRVQVVEHDVGHFALLELDHDPHAVLVGLVAQLADAVDVLVAHQLGNALEQACLVHLVRQLGDHDRLPPAALHLLHLGARAHRQAAAPGLVPGDDLLRPVDDPGGGKVRPRNVLHQPGEGERRIVDQGHAGVDHFAQVVRRDVGRHAHGDAGRAVDQQVRDPGRQDGGLTLLAVVVLHEIDRFLVDVGEHLRRQVGEPAFGVAVGRGRIAVDRAEIALPVDEQVAHGKVLRHAHHRVVGRGVAVRVILAEHLADHARALHVRTRGDVVGLLHREQDPAMHRLEPVADVGQRAAHDHAHRIVEIRLAHLLFEIDRQDFARDIRHAWDCS